MTNARARLPFECLQKLHSMVEAVSFRSALAVGLHMGKSYSEYWVGDKEEFPAGGTLMIPLAMELFQRFDSDRLDPEERLTVGVETGFSEGSSLNSATSGSREVGTLRSLTSVMLTEGKVAIANALLSRLGKASINNFMQHIRMNQSILFSGFGEDECGCGGNCTTSMDLLTMLLYLNESATVRDSWRQVILNDLHRHSTQRRLTANLPSQVWSASLEGDYRNAHHEVAVVHWKNCLVLMAGLTQGAASKQEAENLLAKLGDLVCNGICFE